MHQIKNIPAIISPVLLAFSATSFAQTPVLPSVQVQASAQQEPANPRYAAETAPTVLRSNAPLFETAQSISVITTQQLEAKQARSVTDALQGVAGVSAGAHGRRGWDDFIIRGQISSAQTFIDGLRAQTSTNVFRAEDIAGIDSVAIVKGPTSVGFGMALPGGLVNLTTKRPQAASFQRARVSVGSYRMKEAQWDINHAPQQRTQGAVRLVGRIADQEDPTDYVYFKSRYLAASWNADWDRRNDLSLIFSVQQRKYMRNQGIPSNWNEGEGYPRSIFIGEPDRHYDVDIYRLGANYTHYFDNDWIFKTNGAITKGKSRTDSVFAANTAKFPIIQREISNQDKQDINYTIDSYLQRHFQNDGMHHEITVGLDMMRERSDYWQLTEKTSPLDADQMNYGITSRSPIRPRWNLSYAQYAGLYLRDRLQIANHWIIGLSGRHDWALVDVFNQVNGSRLTNRNRQWTGNASLMYTMHDQFAPYVSYATSFLPVTATGEGGALLRPEKGQQTEVGIKFQALDQRLQGYIAAYTLERQNVTENDAARGFSVQIGKQRTRGIEAEIHAALSAHWNVSATYSYIPTAKTTKSVTTTEIGKRINQIPKHAASVFVKYQFSGAQAGWHADAGIRLQGKRTAQRGANFVAMPQYTLLDAGLGWDSPSWQVKLGIKNLLDKAYIQGTPPAAHLVTFGSPRTWVFHATHTF